MASNIFAATAASIEAAKNILDGSPDLLVRFPNTDPDSAWTWYTSRPGMRGYNEYLHTARNVLRDNVPYAIDERVAGPTATRLVPGGHYISIDVARNSGVGLCAGMRTTVFVRIP